MEKYEIGSAFIVSIAKIAKLEINFAIDSVRVKSPIFRCLGYVIIGVMLGCQLVLKVI